MSNVLKISSFFRPEDIAETIVTVTVSFTQNVNDVNDNLFPQYFFPNIIVSEPFPGGNDTRRAVLVKEQISFGNKTLRLWFSAQSIIFFCLSWLLSRIADFPIALTYMLHSSAQT